MSWHVASKQNPTVSLLGGRRDPPFRGGEHVQRGGPAARGAERAEGAAPKLPGRRIREMGSEEAEWRGRVGFFVKGPGGSTDSH